ncbi:MAG TPA: PrsW family glutamic-type intramembrane protease, partial [Candidatus Thermoplasmatota archaeon]|nr:PrsW family glutamic-type intramembrane protease [Candidatus Thermoplasmatota archaeon]
AYGVNLARSRIRRSVDGAVYGAACGLGFGATENLAYQLQALVEGGTFGWLLTVLARSLSSILVHPAATGVTGYGMARARLGGRGAWAVLPYYAFAVVLHALFNYIAAFLAPFAVGEVVLSLNFLFAVLLAVGAFRVLRGAIARA